MKRFFSILVLVSLLIPAVSFAQNDLDQKDSAWWANFNDQLVTSLNSDVDAIKISSMQHMIFFSETHAESVDFSDANDELINIYTYSDNENMQKMALIVLSHINSGATMSYLNSQVADLKSAELKELTVAVLNEYYN